MRGGVYVLFHAFVYFIVLGSVCRKGPYLGPMADEDLLPAFI